MIQLSQNSGWDPLDMSLLCQLSVFHQSIELILISKRSTSLSFSLTHCHGLVLGPYQFLLNYCCSLFTWLSVSGLSPSTYPLRCCWKELPRRPVLSLLQFCHCISTMASGSAPKAPARSGSDSLTSFHTLPQGSLCSGIQSLSLFSILYYFIPLSLHTHCSLCQERSCLLLHPANSYSTSKT